NKTVNDSQRLEVESVFRSRDFGVQTPALFPPNSKAEQYHAALTTGADELNALVTAQSVHQRDAQEASTVKADARTTLSKFLSRIRSTARTMAMETPGVADKFKIPRNLNDQNLLTAARAFVVEAIPLEAEFISFGLETTFLADLQAAI